MMTTVAQGVAFYDDNKAKEAYEALIEHAENGESEAQYIIGLLYFHGEHVEKSLEKAIVWFKESARRNNLDAMSMLMECDSTTTRHTNRF